MVVIKIVVRLQIYTDYSQAYDAYLCINTDALFIPSLLELVVVSLEVIPTIERTLQGT